jgi:hypothetical protein
MSLNGRKCTSEGSQLHQSASKNVKMATKGPPFSSVDGKANVLLMKMSGLMEGNESVLDELHEQFGCQFLNPMSEGLVGCMRTAFGIPEEGAPMFWMP